jgi:hypothetical protein
MTSDAGTPDNPRPETPSSGKAVLQAAASVGAEAEKTVTLTESQIKALLADAIAQAGAQGALLPPGAYRAEGRVWRKVWVPTSGRTNPTTGQPEQGLRKVRRPVMLVVDQSREGLLRAQTAAYQASPQQDVYHPEHGWLRNGKKPEVDHPANLGSELDNTDVIYVPIGSGDPRAGMSLPTASSLTSQADVKLEPEIPATPEVQGTPEAQA